jgi:hypothetical protein
MRLQPKEIKHQMNTWYKLILGYNPEKNRVIAKIISPSRHPHQPPKPIRQWQRHAQQTAVELQIVERKADEQTWIVFFAVRGEAAAADASAGFYLDWDNVGGILY